MNYNQSNESIHAFNDRRISSIEALRERNGLILGTNIYEPMVGREDVYSPYEAPPLHVPSINEDNRTNPGPLVLHQEDVMAMHDALLDHELASRVSPNVLAFIRNSIHSRMVEQLGLNSSCFNQRLNQNNDVMPASGRAALAGTATVAQAAEARAFFGMESAPLAEITIIGDKRREYISDMFRDVSQLVGHDVSEIAPYRTEVIGFDREPDINKTHHLGAMRIKMKRHLGVLEDGTEVKQRTLAIIDLSPRSGVDSDIVREIFDAYAEGKKTEQKKTTWRNNISH